MICQSGNKVVTSLCTPVSGSTIISGHPDHVLRLWDTRTSGAAASTAASVRSTLTGHKSWVSAVAWAPDSSYHVASASHDGSVLMWDVRSSTPLYTLGAHDDKALAVAFVGATHVVSGACCRVLCFGCPATAMLVVERRQVWSSTGLGGGGLTYVGVVGYTLFPCACWLWSGGADCKVRVYSRSGV